MLWSCSFFIALKKLANDLQDASISYVLATVQQQINSQEGFIESIHLAIEHNPAILSNRTLFQEYSQQAYISSIRYQALIDNIQIVDYLNPSIVCKYHTSNCCLSLTQTQHSQEQKTQQTNNSLDIHQLTLHRNTLEIWITFQMKRLHR